MGLGWSQRVVPPLSPVRTGQDEAYKNAVDNLTPAHLDEFNEAFRRFDSNSSGTQCPRPILCTLRAPSSLDFAHQWCLMRNTNARAHTKQAQTPTQPCPYTHALCSRSRSLSLSSLSLTHTFPFVTDALLPFSITACCPGSIDATELKALMNSIGQHPTDDEVADMISRADADGSGSVDFYEFVTLMAHKMASPGDDRGLRNAFALFDHSGDGFLEADELRRLMINLGENVTLDDINEVIRRVDSNGDGVISEQEFVAAVTKEERRLTRNS